MRHKINTYPFLFMFCLTNNTIDEILSLQNFFYFAERGTVEKTEKFYFYTIELKIHIPVGILFKSKQYFLMKMFVRMKNNSTLLLNTFHIYKSPSYTIKLQ